MMKQFGGAMAVLGPDNAFWVDGEWLEWMNHRVVQHRRILVALKLCLSNNLLVNVGQRFDSLETNCWSPRFNASTTP